MRVCHNGPGFNSAILHAMPANMLSAVQHPSLRWPSGIRRRPPFSSRCSTLRSLMPRLCMTLTCS